MNPTLDKFFRL